MENYVNGKSKKQVSFEDALRGACNKLRGTVEPAEYKHVVLSLIPKKEMELFENEISPFFNSILVNEKEISKLQELKQFVISHISGM